MSKIAPNLVALAYVAGLFYFLFACASFLASQDKQLLLFMFILYAIVPVLMKIAHAFKSLSAGGKEGGGQ